MASTPVALRADLPPLPDHMRRLPVVRGYPVPWFVAWLDEENNEVPVGEGRAEFRVLRPTAIREALQFSQCWVCGGQLGRYKAFTTGTMCMVNRINAEPPSHVECADFSALACPFLTRPHMVRREAGLDFARGEMPGMAILDNPSAACVWVIDGGFSIKRVPNGALFNLPEPREVRIYTDGRLATRDETRAVIEERLPVLLATCQTDEERAEVRARAEATERYWPAA